jgi:hypothetical protein
MARGFLRFIVAAAAALAAFSLSAPVLADETLRNEFYNSLGGASSAKARGTDRGEVSAGPTVLLVTGMIGPGSYDEFRSALARGTPELVVIDGPGGILEEALLIGQEVRRRHLSTLVSSNRQCASACAVVFLSGRTRYVGSGAAIGLHSASYADGRVDPEATAVMADYLRGVGVPSATLKRMARTMPSDIRWLTKAEQKAIGIRPFAGQPR